MLHCVKAGCFWTNYQHYSSWWALASITTLLQPAVSSAVPLQLLTPITILSNHLVHDCPFLLLENYTVRFLMFSVITNIYNKKIKGLTLTELFTATGKLKKFFLTTRDVRCVHHGWHGTHRYDIQVLATRWCVCGKNLNIILMCSVSPMVHASNISSCQEKLFQFFCSCEQFC